MTGTSGTNGTDSWRQIFEIGVVSVLIKWVIAGADKSNKKLFVIAV